MAWKLYMRSTVSAALLILVAASVAGCASRRQSKNADASVSNVTPSRLPSVSVSDNSSRLSGIPSSGASASTASVSTVGPASVDDSSELGSTRSTYSSASPSQGACSSGGCGR